MRGVLRSAVNVYFHASCWIMKMKLSFMCYI